MNTTKNLISEQIDDLLEGKFSQKEISDYLKTGKNEELEDLLEGQFSQKELINYLHWA